MTQMVNVLGAKMKIGAPMICSYLLGLPDHYTNRTFTTFYWKSFVSEAKNDWLNETDKPEDDYIHRATGLEHMCLYEWICRCHRVSNGKSIDEPDQLDVYNDTDSVIEHLENKGDDCDASSEPCKSDSSDDKHSINSFIVNDETYDLTLVNHGSVSPPLTLKEAVPNFAGGMLLRKDVGDREYYCLTITCMLTLFRPWRRGKDLKIENISWDRSFINFKLLPWQDKIISNFNLRYECMDARDDYNAQLKQGG
ncbi:hypothetical protein EDD85DRAFT_728027, partial [Armillaria nabsnona]